MYAIIETGGKQYKVQKGDVIYTEKINNTVDNLVEFDKIIACQSERGFLLGKPYVEGAKVFGKILKTGKCRKITVFTYKPKKHVKRKMGHRQYYSKVEIDDIVSNVNDDN